MSENSPSPRDRIIEAAFTAFVQSGYEGASTNEIARLARVSKRDLYAHFRNKQAMLAAGVTDRVKRMQRPLDLPVPADRAALRETLIGYGTTVLHEISHPEVLATYQMALLNAATTPSVAQTLDQFGRLQTTRGLAELLEVMRERGIVGGADPAEMAGVFFGILVGDRVLRMLMQVQPPPTEAEARDRARLATDSLLRLYCAA